MLGFTGRSLPDIGRCCHCLESKAFRQQNNQARHFGKVQGYIILGLEWQVASMRRREAPKQRQTMNPTRFRMGRFATRAMLV
jgi:hypothetical protein